MSTPDDLLVDGVVVTQTDIPASNVVIDEGGGVILPSIAAATTKKD